MQAAIDVKQLNFRLRRSLAARVILSTMLLSLGVVWLTGSALNSKLADGITQVNLSSSLVEARSTFFSTQYQVQLADGETEAKLKKAVSDAVNAATSITTTEGRREVILIKVPNQKIKTTLNFDTTSGLALASSVPNTLRAAVRKSGDVHSAYSSISYPSIGAIRSLVIGEVIHIPGAGKYEMYIIFSLSNLQATLGLIQSSLILTGLALILLIALITWLVVRQVVRPVRLAAHIAEQFTKGDFSQRMKVDRGDEIAILGSAFNEMALSLEQQISRLENLSRVQQRFVSDVSHELRTPLTTLRMASEVIYGHRASFDPAIARSAELLIGQLDRFEGLLEDLLEISRFDAQVATLETADFDLVRLIQRCIADMGPEELSTPIRIKRRSEEVFISADIRRVERIMRNLLSNALDHADGKPIEVRIVETGDEVAVGVRDHGSGLDEASLLQVFDRFWRADPSRARIRGGTGLGLSIALEDARLHNGELDAWGRRGAGAHFVLTIPRVAGGAIASRPLRLQPEDYYEST